MTFALAIHVAYATSYTFWKFSISSHTISTPTIDDAYTLCRTSWTCSINYDRIVGLTIDAAYTTSSFITVLIWYWC